MARLLSETELKIHAGWGAESDMAAVYVHLDEKDVANKLLEKYGIKPKDESIEDGIIGSRICPNTLCSYDNPQEAQFCLKCGYPLTLKNAIKMAHIKKKEDELQNEILSKDMSPANLAKTGDIREAMYQVLKSDPQLVEKLKEIVELTIRK